MITDAYPSLSIGGNPKVRRPCVLEDGRPSHSNEGDKDDNEDQGRRDEGVAEHEGEKTFGGGGTLMAWPQNSRGSMRHGCVVSVVVYVGMGQEGPCV